MRLWASAVAALRGLLADERDAGAAAGGAPAARHFFVRYALAWRDLERAYAGLCHAQQRVDVVRAAELAASRMLQLRPGGAAVADFCDELAPLGLPPEALEPAAPLALRAAGAGEVRVQRRHALVAGHAGSGLHAGGVVDADWGAAAMQGMGGGEVGETAAPPPQPPPPPPQPPSEHALLEASLAADLASQLHAARRASDEAYATALATARREVEEDEGACLRLDMRAARGTWLARRLASGQGVPTDLTAFYEEEAAAAAAAAAPAAPAEAPSASSTGGRPKKAPPSRGSASGADGKPSTPGAAAVATVAPLAAPAAFLSSLAGALADYDARWAAGCSGYLRAATDMDMALVYSAVRPAVVSAVRSEVDAAMLVELANCRAAAAAGGGGAAASPAASAAKTTKKGTAAAATAAPAAAKPPAAAAAATRTRTPLVLPGAKLCTDVSSIDVALAELCGQGIVCAPRPAQSFASYLGGCRVGNTADGAAAASPSPAQLREALVHGLVVPALCSAAARRDAAASCEAAGLGRRRPPRALLLYGAAGVGKTHLANAIAQAMGALVLDLSARTVAGRYPEPGQHARLLHLAFELARDASAAPVVIFLDEVELLLPAARPSSKATGAAAAAAASGPARFRRDLVTYVQSLTADDATVIVGCTRNPSAADFASLTEVFDAALFVPCPGYGDRRTLWRVGLSRRLAPPGTSAGVHTPPLPLSPAAAAVGAPDCGGAQMTAAGVDVSALAAVSEGWSSGAILHTAHVASLAAPDVLAALARFPRVEAEELERWRVFGEAWAAAGVPVPAPAPAPAASAGGKRGKR